MKSASAKITSRRENKTKSPRKITPQYLGNVAVFYLGRYSASEQSLRVVLHRRLQKSGQRRDAECLAMVEATIESMRRQGFLNDQNYAANRARNLSQSGKSLRRIRVGLQQKGVDEGIIESTLRAMTHEDPELEWKLALRFAQRRKLGPYATGKIIEPSKQIQKFAAAGFSYPIAQKIIRMRMDDLE